MATSMTQHKQIHLRRGVAPSSGISSPRFLTIANPDGDVMISLATAAAAGAGWTTEEEANVKADTRLDAT